MASPTPEGRGQTAKLCEDEREGLIGFFLGTVCNTSLRSELQPQPPLCSSSGHTALLGTQLPGTQLPGTEIPSPGHTAPGHTAPLGTQLPGTELTQDLQD